MSIAVPLTGSGLYPADEEADMVTVVLRGTAGCTDGWLDWGKEIHMPVPPVPGMLVRLQAEREELAVSSVTWSEVRPVAVLALGSPQCFSDGAYIVHTKENEQRRDQQVEDAAKRYQENGYSVVVRPRQQNAMPGDIARRPQIARAGTAVTEPVGEEQQPCEHGFLQAALRLESFDHEWSSLMKSCPGGTIVYDDPARKAAVMIRDHFQSGEDADGHGVYVIRKILSGVILYIGKAGTVGSEGDCKQQTLMERLTNVRDGQTSANNWFSDLYAEEGPFAVEYVLLQAIPLSPALAESLLLQAYLNEHQSLPHKNKCL